MFYWTSVNDYILNKDILNKGKLGDSGRKITNMIMDLILHLTWINNAIYDIFRPRLC